MTNIIGYLRPDINGQNIQSQFDQLKASGVSQIVQEKTAGTKRNRSQLDKLIMEAQAGDTVVAASLYHIADNTKHLLEIIESLNAAGASLKIIDNGIDTSTAQGDVIRVLLGAIADLSARSCGNVKLWALPGPNRQGAIRGESRRPWRSLMRCWH